MKDFDMETKTAIIFVDAQTALNLVHGDVLHRKSKHLATKIHYIREQIQLGRIEFKKITSACNVADIMTKQMPKDLYLKLCNVMFNPDIFLRRPVKETIPKEAGKMSLRKWISRKISIKHVDLKEKPKYEMGKNKTEQACQATR